MDKKLDDKLIYTPNYDKQNYPFCKLKNIGTLKVCT